MQLRRHVTRGLGSLYIWWGIHGGFAVGALGALWFGTFAGGLVAAVGVATTGFDGVYEALVALAVVLVVASLGVVGWTVATYGADAVGLADEAVGVLMLATHVRQQFLLPVVLGGATGGLLGGRLRDR